MAEHDEEKKPATEMFEKGVDVGGAAGGAAQGLAPEGLGGPLVKGAGAGGKIAFGIDELLERHIADGAIKTGGGIGEGAETALDVAPGSSTVHPSSVRTIRAWTRDAQRSGSSRRSRFPARRAVRSSPPPISTSSIRASASRSGVAPIRSHSSATASAQSAPVPPRGAWRRTSRSAAAH